jgi:hypothetical protein
MARPESVAHRVFELTALSKDDVVAETTLELACDHLQRSAVFFYERLEEGFFHENSIEKVRNIAETNEMLTAALLDDYTKDIEFQGKNTPAYIAAADQLDLIADVLRKLELFPEWKEYYDDMARKLNEYSVGLRNDPQSSFRAI